MGDNDERRTVEFYRQRAEAETPRVKEIVCSGGGSIYEYDGVCFQDRSNAWVLREMDVLRKAFMQLGFSPGDSFFAVSRAYGDTWASRFATGLAWLVARENRGGGL